MFLLQAKDGIRDRVRSRGLGDVCKRQGLTVEYAKKRGASVLLRGLRTSFDFEYEMQLSQTNHALYNDIKTVFLITQPEFNFISSSCVREILINKGDISGFVPEAVCRYLTMNAQALS